MPQMKALQVLYQCTGVLMAVHVQCAEVMSCQFLVIGFCFSIALTLQVYNQL